jgi:basic membrane protein A and related proteins
VARLTQFVLLAVVLAGLAACQQSPDCVREEVVCAALVTDTLGVNDHGMNQDAWAGLQAAKASGLADEIAYIESVDARDYQKNIAYFTDRGYDVIFASGIGLQDETLRAANLHPASVFVGLNHPPADLHPNFISVTFPEDQMGFAAGILAARLTKTGVVAGLCETSGIDSMWRYCEGFRAGVESIDKSLRILIVYRDDGHREKLFVDEAWGYENASRLIFRGADVVFAAGGVTGQGALRAAVNSGVYAIGTERDQAAVLAGSGSGVVTSFRGRTSLEVQEVMRLFKERQVSMARSGQIIYTPLGGIFPESLKNELESVLVKLWTGEVRTSVISEKP